MENSKVYLSTQLLSLLPPIVCKLALFLVNWQNSPKGIMLYEHRFAKTLKMTEQEVRLGIQTLINLRLIDLTNIDGKFRIEFNSNEWQKYYKASMEKVIEHEGYKMASQVTYDKVEEKKQSSNDISDMSDAELKMLLKRIQVSLNEREQMKSKVVSMENDEDDYDYQLPF